MRSLLLLLLCVASVFAEDQTVTHRITGLFSQDRETDLHNALAEIPGVKLANLDFDHAEGVFTYDPAVAFNGTKPEKIVERFNDLLRNASKHTLGIAPLSTTPKDKLIRIEIPVAGLDCKACALAAYEGISKIEGVTAATASFKQGKVTALIDPEKITREALQEALKKKGVALQ